MGTFSNTFSNGLVHLGSLLNLLPDGQIRIDGKVWMQTNFNEISTPLGNSLIEIQAAANLERINGGDFETGLKGILVKGDETAAWIINTTNPIAGSYDAILSVTSTGTNINRPCINFTNWLGITNKYYKISFDYKVNSGTCILKAIHNGLTNPAIDVQLTGSGKFTSYIKCLGQGANFGLIYFLGTNVFSIQIDNVSIQEINWNGLSDYYTGLIALGETEKNALDATAAWAFHSNNTTSGEVYGRIYNGKARDRISMDIEGTNWHIATEAELTALALKGGYALKESGTEHWLTDNGTNTTKFTALGGAYRSNVDGSFGTIKETTAFWSADSDKVLVLNHADNSAIITSVTKDYGAYIRLVSDMQFPIPLT